MTARLIGGLCMSEPVCARACVYTCVCVCVHTCVCVSESVCVCVCACVRDRPTTRHQRTHSSSGEMINNLSSSGGDLVGEMRSLLWIGVVTGAGLGLLAGTAVFLFDTVGASVALRIRGEYVANLFACRHWAQGVNMLFCMQCPRCAMLFSINMYLTTPVLWSDWNHGLRSHGSVLITTCCNIALSNLVRIQ